MSKLPEMIALSSDEEARRLWRGAVEARARADADFIALCEALDLGVHAAEILAIQKLQPVRDKFPATIALQLEMPAAALDVERDAITAPKAIGFTDVLDLASAEGLECVGPRLHRGWEDRRFACRRSRATAFDALGFALEQGERDLLMVLSAYRNRIFRYPPPLEVRPAEITGAWSALSRLVERLTAG